MTLIATVPMIFCLAGLLVYLFAARPKVCEAGRLMFACGLLVALYVLATHVVKLGG